MADPTGNAAFSFDVKEGEKLVKGGYAIAVIAAIAAVLSGHLAILAVSALAVLVALHYGPMANPKRPQLVVLEDGLVVDGLGLLPWETIASVQRTESYVRTVASVELHVATRAPVKASVRPQTSLSPMRRVQTMIWSLPDPARLKLKIGSLKGIEAIEPAIRAHLPPAAAA
ncbi:MAG: hypothetical protein H6923_03795 [Alphaproteobacteria bacterium]|nr:hypothetical protein [Alphaproteobacteria bacterium]